MYLWTLIREPTNNVDASNLRPIRDVCPAGSHETVFPRGRVSAVKNFHVRAKRRLGRRSSLTMGVCVLAAVTMTVAFSPLTISYLSNRGNGHLLPPDMVSGAGFGDRVFPQGSKCYATIATLESGDARIVPTRRRPDDD